MTLGLHGGARNNPTRSLPGGAVSSKTVLSRPELTLGDNPWDSGNRLARGVALPVVNAAEPSGSEGHRRRSQLTVMVGLFVTFGGLVGYGLQVPTQPASLVSIVPWLGVGFLTAWTGGILIGNSRVALPAGGSPALKGQLAVGAAGTLAGSLSSVVVIQRVGPWVHLAPGAPVELVTAVIAVSMVWVGGMLMGVSMRRFVRRRRRRGRLRAPDALRQQPE